MQDSFEIPRGQASRDGDIELGTHAPLRSGDLGLENFFKKVVLFFIYAPNISEQEGLSSSLNFIHFFL